MVEVSIWNGPSASLGGAGTVSTIVVAVPVSILLQQRWTGPAPRTSGAKQPVGKAGRRHPSKADRARRRAGDGAVV